MYSFLKSKGIEYISAVPLSDCEIIKPHLIKEDYSTAVIFLVPYYSGSYELRNVSLYAVPRDYHIYFSKLFIELETYMKERYPDNKFKGFSDHSPLNETDSAAKAGLGVLGDNGLLINERYGSYVFIGEILTDLKYAVSAVGKRSCPHCGICKISCPSPEHCLSGLTQSKGELGKDTAEIMRASGIIWGCDICQEVCPMNAYAETTPIEFFKTELRPIIEAGCELEDRAYGWRGRNCIERNLRSLR